MWYIEFMALTKADLKAIDKLLDRRLSEQRKEINKDINGRFAEQRKAINQDIAGFIAEKIIPRLDQLNEMSEDVKETLTVVDRIERHLDKHEDRIERLEQIHPQGRHQTGV